MDQIPCQFRYSETTAKISAVITNDLLKFIMHSILQTCFIQVSLGAITYMVDILIDNVYD